MKRKVKLGIIGTGIAAKKLHLPALRRLSEEFEITAVCNHTEFKAKEYSKLVGDVPYYLDYRKLLKDPNVEAVDIVLPIELNYKVTKAALKAGKHVIVEKPLAVNLKQAGKMLDFRKKYDSVMMVAENYRYKKVFKKAKEVIDSGIIGNPYAAQWNIFYHNSGDNEYGAIKWRQNHVYEGGFLTDAGVHDAAALRYLFGEAKTVNALTDSVNRVIGTHDTLFSLIHFDSGVKVNFNLFFSSVNHTENRLLIFCRKGTIEINEYSVQVKKSDSSVDAEDFGEDYGFYEEFLDFHNAITTGEKVISVFDEAYKDLELILNIISSARKEKVVKM